MLAPTPSPSPHPGSKLPDLAIFLLQRVTFKFIPALPQLPGDVLGHFGNLGQLFITLLFAQRRSQPGRHRQQVISEQGCRGAVVVPGERWAWRRVLFFVEL